jgi:hypothetical protein
MEQGSLTHILSLKDANQAVFVNAVSQYILKQNKCFDSQSAMLGKDIYAKYSAILDKHKSLQQIAQNSFGVTLSLISHSSSSTSAIKSAGKKQGYYLDKEMLNPDSTENRVSTKIKEKDLYSILTRWLNTKIDKAIDASNKRGAKKWQNADILGISFINDVGREDFELHAMEVKVLHNNWRVDLFQAVSHSRFANRSYFAFLLRGSDIDKLENDLKEYAYQFGIGLVAIVIKDEYWNNILAKKQELTLSDTDDDSICEIREISFAPYHRVNPTIRTTFLEQAFDIRSIQDLRNKF